MNWRLLTAINAAIALITVSAVIFSVTRSRPEQSRAQRRQTTASESSGETKHSESQQPRVHIESVDDLANARVDDLGSVPAVELTDLMRRATPEQLAMLAAKFNDAPMDARTLGGMDMFFQAWAELAPNAALTGAFALKDVTFRKLAVGTVVGSASPSAAPELIAYITQHPDKDLLDDCKNKFLSPLIDNWSTLDPEAASKFMDQLGDTKSDLNFKARSNIAYNWGSLDPTAAMEWIEKQKDKDFVNRDALYDNVINGWCLKDIKAASEYVRGHLDDPAAESAASSVAEYLFSRDLDGATNWIGSLPSGEPRKNAESTLARDWVEKDPSASVKWLATLPENEQTNVVGTITRSWADNNWTETSRWIDTLSGDVRDYAVSSAMSRDGATESDSLTLALSIRDDELRQTRIQDVIQYWAYRDPEAAEEWVKNSTLSPDQKQQLSTIISSYKEATETTAEQ